MKPDNLLLALVENINKNAITIIETLNTQWDKNLSDQVATMDKYNQYIKAFAMINEQLTTEMERINNEQRQQPTKPNFNTILKPTNH